MTRWVRTLHLTALTLGALAARPITAAADPAPNPSCIQARAEYRYIGFAYDHLVTIRNACDQPAACTVTTNVNPDPIDVRVPEGETRSVLTYHGSPSREFTFELRCTLPR